MENRKNLVPYSVYLPPDIYARLKEAAKDRKAAETVRNGVTMILENEDAFNGGYNRAIRDVIEMLEDNEAASSISINGTTLAESVIKDLNDMILPQNMNGGNDAKEKS